MCTEHNMQLESNKTKIPGGNKTCDCEIHFIYLIFSSHSLHSLSHCNFEQEIVHLSYHIIPFQFQFLLTFSFDLCVHSVHTHIKTGGRAHAGSLKTQLAEILMSGEHCLIPQYCCQVNRNQKVLPMCNSAVGTILAFNVFYLSVTKHWEPVFFIYFAFFFGSFSCCPWGITWKVHWINLFFSFVSAKRFFFTFSQTYACTLESSQFNGSNFEVQTFNLLMACSICSGKIWSKIQTIKTTECAFIWTNSFRKC